METKLKAALIFWCLLLAIPLVILNGFVLSILWGWFVAPTFGLPALAIPQAIGIAAVASYMLPARTSSGGDSIEELIKALVMGCARPLLALAFAWPVTWFL